MDKRNQRYNQGLAIACGNSGFKSVGTERIPQGQLGIRHGFAHFARVNSVLRLYVCVGHDQPT
jgi:hypothetical protein